MKNKAFKLGIIVGRFQTFHTGHLYMVDKACAVCDRVGVFVGSSQESGTLKNPFTYEQRRDMLKKVFGDSVIIYPLPDIGVGNNSRWGDYVARTCAAASATRLTCWFRARRSAGSTGSTAPRA